MENARLSPGTILAEKYRLESVLGVGGMGTVYRAEHLALKAPVAIKIIDRDVSDGEGTIARFMREAQAAASLRSPHVVQILDYGTDGERPFMVMEMLEGETLSDRIEKRGRLSAQETYRVVSHVAKAVSRAHEADIVHRDLKPDNVFLVFNGGDEIAKVLDFGVAKVEATALGGEGHTRTGSLLGTPFYMSPEQAQGNKTIDARSDLWALGVIAFECMTGARPFSSDGLGDLVLQICIRDIPLPSTYAPLAPGFDAWFLRACEREADQRFQSAQELTEALYEALCLGDELAPIPESRWSQLGGSDTTYDVQEADSTLPDLADSQRLSQLPTQSDIISPLAPTATLSGDTLRHGTAAQEPTPAPGSQWEVVPHGSREPSLDIQLPMTTPSGRSSITLWVALIALLVGGGIVLGLRHLSRAEDDAASPPRSSQPIPPAPPKTKPVLGPNPRPRAPALPPPRDQPEGAAPSTKTGAEQDAKLDEVPALDETDDAPRKDAAERDAQDKRTNPGDQPPPAAAPGAHDHPAAAPAPKENPPKENPEPGPTPQLPEGLQPTPEPPAPVN